MFGIFPVTLLVTVAAMAPPAVTPDFTRDVAPILQRNCVRCHGERETEGGLRLDSYAGFMRGGDSGPPIVVGNSWESLVIKKLDHRDKPSMPPKKRLAASMIETIRVWIDSGAKP